MTIQEHQSPEPQPEDPAQGDIFKFLAQNGEIPTVANSSQIADGTERPKDGAPGIRGASPADLAVHDTPAALVEEPSRRGIGNLSKRTKGWMAGGALVAVAAGAFAATRVGGENPAPKAKAGNTAPASPTEQSTPSATIPSASQSPTPTTLPSLSTSPSPSETATSSSDLPPIPPQTESTPVPDGELGTIPSVPTSYFESLVDKDTVAQYIEKYPGLKNDLDPVNIAVRAQKNNVTGAAIAAYQHRLIAAYKDPATQQMLGDIAGSMSPELLANSVNKQDIFDNLPATYDSFLWAVANNYSSKNPAAKLDLLKLTSLSKDMINNNASQIVNDHVNQPPHAISRSTKMLQALNYNTLDGAKTTLMVGMSDYSDGSTYLTFYVGIPDGGAAPRTGPDEFIPVPFSSIKY
jgi:hypothetical protein